MHETVHILWYRYIEIFKSSVTEVHQFMSSDGGGGNNMGGPRPTQRPRPYDRYNNHYGNGERMRPPPLRGFRNSMYIFNNVPLFQIKF